MRQQSEERRCESVSHKAMCALLHAHSHCKPCFTTHSLDQPRLAGFPIRDVRGKASGKRRKHLLIQANGLLFIMERVVMSCAKLAM